MKLSKKKKFLNIYFWLAIVIISGIFFGLLFAGFLIGNNSFGKATNVVFNQNEINDSQMVSAYFCDCGFCGESIYGSFDIGVDCRYLGAPVSRVSAIDSCNICCVQHNCSFSNIIYN